MLQSQTHWAGGFEQQRSRPPPAAETGRRGWGSAPLFQSPAKGLQKKRQAQLVRPAVQFGGQKSPCGAFLDARLAISTRAHQKTSTYESTLRFLFCRHFFRTGRDDHRLRRKQGGEAGAALRVPFYSARLAKSMKNAQTKTTVRVDGGSVIA